MSNIDKGNKFKKDKFSEIKLTVLYLAPCGLQEGIGGSARLSNMVNLLLQMGANINLISYLPGERFGIKKEKVTDYLYTITINVKRSSLRIFKTIGILETIKYGLDYIRAIDIIFAHAPGIVTGFPALILSKTFKKPLIVDHMDIKDSNTPKLIYESVLRNSNLVLAISRYLEEEVKRLGNGKVLYFPISIDTDIFRRNEGLRKKIRAELALDEKDIVIGYTGSFWRGEGVSFLLRAFNKLCYRYNHLKLVLIGAKNTPDSEDIPSLLQELKLGKKALLLPPQPHNSIPGFLSSFDIACSPKIDCLENRAANPIKIYEYMSMELIVVSSQVGEISNLIVNGHDGFLVKSGDEKELERTLAFLIENWPSLQAIGERAREIIVNNFSKEIALNKIKESIMRLLSNGMERGFSPSN